MRWIAILLLLAGITGARAVPAQASGSTAANSAKSPDKSPVYVGGQVQKSGQYYWFQGMTVIAASNTASEISNSNCNHLLIDRIDSTRINFRADTFPYGFERPPPVNASNSVFAI